MRTVFFIMGFLFSLNCFAATGTRAGEYLIIEPATAPSSCVPGQMIVDTADNEAKLCLSGSFDPLITEGSTTGFDQLSPLTTEGDLLIFDGSNNARLAGGSDSQVLTYDSAVSGNIKWAAAAISVTVESKTADFTAAVDSSYNVDLTNGNVTATLPAVSGNSGKSIEIKLVEASTFTLTVDGNASETIDDATTIELRSDDESLLLRTDGTEWNIIASKFTEYQSVEITSNTTTTLANTLTAVTGSGLVLDPGTWEMCYSVLMYIDDNSGAANAVTGAVGIYDSGNSLVDFTLSDYYDNLGSGENTGVNLHKCVNLTVSSSDTYDLGIRCTDATANGFCRIYGPSFSGDLTDDDNHSMVTARRVK